MLLSEDEMEVTIIDSKDANKITEDLLEVERKLRKIESKQNEPEEKKDDSTTQTGRISIGDLRTRPEGPSSSESSASTPKLHALVITGDTLVIIILVSAFFQNEPDYYSGKFFFLSQTTECMRSGHFLQNY